MWISLLPITKAISLQTAAREPRLDNSPKITLEIDLSTGQKKPHTFTVEQVNNKLDELVLIGGAIKKEAGPAVFGLLMNLFTKLNVCHRVILRGAIPTNVWSLLSSILFQKKVYHLGMEESQMDFDHLQVLTTLQSASFLVKENSNHQTDQNKIDQLLINNRYLMSMELPFCTDSTFFRIINARKMSDNFKLSVAYINQPIYTTNRLSIDSNRDKVKQFLHISKDNLHVRVNSFYENMMFQVLQAKRKFKKITIDINTCDGLTKLAPFFLEHKNAETVEVFMAEGFKDSGPVDPFNALLQQRFYMKNIKWKYLTLDTVNIDDKFEAIYSDADNAERLRAGTAAYKDAIKDLKELAIRGVTIRGSGKQDWDQFAKKVCTPYVLDVANQIIRCTF